MLRQALARQAQQSAVALGVAACAVLLIAPSELLINAAVDFAQQHDVPFGKVTALAALSVSTNIAVEALMLRMMRGKPSLGTSLLVFAIQLALWALTLGVASLLGATRVGVASLPIALAIYSIASPLAVLLKPGQRCDSRLRRVARELQAGVMRALVTGAAFTVDLYVYLTVFTHFTPALEVFVMGIGMPLLQVACISVLADRLGRLERAVWHVASMRRRMDKAVAVEGAASASAPPATAAVANKYKAAGAAKSKARKRAGGSTDRKARVSLVMVLSAETMYSSGIFVALALAESDETFFISLTAMVVIEVVQVAVHVKLRRMASRVVASDTVDIFLGDDTSIREWLLYQELGEKIGVLLAIGTLVVTKAMGNAAPVLATWQGTQLVQRGLAMLLFELVGDLSKDIVSQALGVVPTYSSGDGRASLDHIGVAVSVLIGLIAAGLTRSALALGAPG